MSGPNGKNQPLYKARQQKKDEFYTQLSDIENELRHYKGHFEDKIVYCNCDDPTVSNFYKYFAANFSHLKLKGLIATCYRNQQRDLFSRHDSDRALKIEYWGFRERETVHRVEDANATLLERDGDFRSPECVEMLKRADIVVTNPPFSLFREYVTQLIEHDKKFLIIGNQNAITYKEIFPHIKEERLWLGYGFNAGNAYFAVPPSTKEYAAGVYDENTGLVKFRNVTWFTNLDHKKRHEDLILYKKYSTEEYPKYDNYDAIEVSYTKNIPMDYDGVMGVPITFLDKYNPDQFEIEGITQSWFGAATKIYPSQVQVSTSGGRSEVTKLNDGAALQVAGPIDKTYYMVNGKYYQKVYARVLIKRKRAI